MILGLFFPFGKLFASLGRSFFSLLFFFSSVFFTHSMLIVGKVGSHGLYFLTNLKALFFSVWFLGTVFCLLFSSRKQELLKYFSIFFFFFPSFFFQLWSNIANMSYIHIYKYYWLIFWLFLIIFFSIFSDFFWFFLIFSEFFRFFQKKILDILFFFLHFFQHFFTIQSFFNTIFTRALDLHLSLVIT